MAKETFQQLQNKLESLPESFFLEDPEGYRFICETILMESGWSEEEYLGYVLKKVENGEVRLGQNRRLRRH